MTFYNPLSSFNLAGKTIVIPVVSAANVSQLAADLLIASLSLRRVAIFDPGFFVPVVSSREDSEEGICTPLELYGRDGINVVVIQQRSPVLKSQKQEFVDTLLQFIETSGVTSALFLSGMDQSTRTDVQMLVPTYRIHLPNSPELVSAPLNRLTILPIPVYSSPNQNHEQVDIPHNEIPFIPGGGLTRRVLQSIATRTQPWVTPTAALVQFALEGDNRADARLLTSLVAKILGLDELIKEWREPSSWKQGLFGTPHDQTLYG